MDTDTVMDMVTDMDTVTGMVTDMVMDMEAIMKKIFPIKNLLFGIELEKGKKNDLYMQY